MTEVELKLQSLKNAHGRLRRAQDEVNKIQIEIALAILKEGKK